MRSNFDPKEIKRANKLLDTYLTEAKKGHKKGKRIKLFWKKFFTLIK